MSTDDRPLAPNPGDPRDRDPDPGVEGDADEMLGVKSDDEVIPASPGGRRRAILIALVFLGAMIVFWVLFIATHTDTRDGDGMLGGVRVEHALSGLLHRDVPRQLIPYF